MARSTAAARRTEVNQMPVEESGNMLIMMAAFAKAEGNAAFAAKYWPLLQRWADYLKEKGLDPENQLSTDDFAGHLAHNANLSIKAILALGSYSMLAEMTGPQTGGREYRKTAEQFAKKWQDLAAERRPLPPGVRQGRHVEPEVQPGLGSDSRAASVSRRDRAKGNGVLREDAEPVRHSAR